jgi:hypothetical protein
MWLFFEMQVESKFNTRPYIIRRHMVSVPGYTIKHCMLLLLCIEQPTRAKFVECAYYEAFTVLADEPEWGSRLCFIKGEPEVESVSLKTLVSSFYAVSMFNVIGNLD